MASQAKKDKQYCLVNGDDGKIWATTPKYGEVLKEQGFEILK